MKFIKAVIPVSDDFEAGCCYKCPFSYEKNYNDDGYTECETACVFGARFTGCPLKVEKTT